MSGISLPKKLHRGSQPSFILYTSSWSLGAFYNKYRDTSFTTNRILDKSQVQAVNHHDFHHGEDRSVLVEYPTRGVDGRKFRGGNYNRPEITQYYGIPEE